MSKITFSPDKRSDAYFHFDNGYEVAIHGLVNSHGEDTAFTVLCMPISFTLMESPPMYMGKSFDKDGLLFLGAIKPEKVAEALLWASVQPSA
jgi:hypothetical protein